MSGRRCVVRFLQSIVALAALGGSWVSPTVTAGVTPIRAVGAARAGSVTTALPTRLTTAPPHAEQSVTTTSAPAVERSRDTRTDNRWIERDDPGGHDLGPPRPAKHVEGELLVKFRRGTSVTERSIAHGWSRAQRLRSFKVVPDLEHVRLPAGANLKEAIALYQAHPDVLYVEPNYVVTAIQSAAVAPGDPQFGAQWGLHNAGQAGGTPDADIDAPEAWNITTGSSAVVVAQLDTGIDYTHADLAANMFRNTADCNANGVDDDGNGYIDDCYGIDTANNDSDPADDNGHGTHTAGTIGAVGDNNLGVVGVNWHVRLLPCKFLDASGSGTTAAAIACLEYVKTMKDRGVNIVATSNSWGGGGYSKALYDAIDAQRQRGILFIAAAGNASSNNDSSPSYPASYNLPNIISVAATTRTDGLAGFSNYGRRTVHLGAPGNEILSTTPNNTYGTLSGTSMATPHVSGVAALLKAQDPSRDWRAIKNLILAGGDTIPSLANTVTGKRLNAYGALTCSNSTVTSRLLPVAGLVAGRLNTAIPLSVLNINCADPNGTVTVGVSPGGSTITLVDDGTSGDQTAGDGIYTGQFTPSVAQPYVLTFPGGDVVVVAVPFTYDVAATTYNYRQIAGTNLGLGDDTVATITPPFPVLFGGIASPTLYVGSNGVLSVSGSTNPYFNVALPDPLVQSLVAPLWDDLYPNGAQNVYWDVTGTAPHRELVVEWRDVPTWRCSNGGTLKFQTVFFEGSSDILFNYADTVIGGACVSADYGGEATVGVQMTPTGATQIGFNTAVLTDQLALLWTLPAAPPPMLSVTPNTMDFGRVDVGGSVDRTFTIRNIGAGTLTGQASAAAPFIIVSGGTFALGAAASQELVVRFSPTAPGPVNAIVSVTSDASSASLTVTGTATSNATFDVGPDFGTWSIGQIERPLTATGGDGPYTWSIVSGSLPPGVGLRTDLPSFFPPEASAGLIGVATTPGTFHFTLRVTSGGQSADQACTLKITGLTIKDPATLPTAVVGRTYSYGLTALNASGPPTWSATGAPAWLSLTADGILSGNPTTPGVAVMGLTLTDGIDTVSRTVTVHVSAVTITTPGVLPNAIRDEAYSITLSAAGGTEPYTFTGDVPPGLALSASGTIAGTVPATTAPGPWPLLITVTDADNRSSSTYLTLDIVGAPATLPSVAAYGHLDGCTIGVPCSRGFSVRSGGTAPFTWTAAGLPPGVSLRSGSGMTEPGVHAGQGGYEFMLAAGDAEVWGVPTATGTYNVQLIVTDAAGVSASNTFPLRVSGLLQTSALPAGTIERFYLQVVRVIGGTEPYTVAEVDGQWPAGLQLDSYGQLLYGAPAENGRFVRTLLVSDALGQSSQLTNYLLVDGAGPGVTITDAADLGAVAAQSMFSRQLSACCLAPYVWSVVGAGLPPGIDLSPDGLLRGAPTTTGTYTFLIKASGSALSVGVRQFTLAVVDGLLAITGESTLPNGLVDELYTYGFAATGGSGALAWSLAPFTYLPPGLSLDASSGIVSGTPSAFGQFGFTINVTDGGQTATRSFNVSMYPAGTGGRISGTVTAAATGTGIEGVLVQIYNSSAALVTTAVSDASGRYLSGIGLPTGIYFARTLNAAGYANRAYNNLPCIGSCDVTAATPIPVTSPNATVAIDFALAYPPPAPTLTLVSPSTVVAGSGAVTVTVTGANFVWGSTVQVDGAARPTSLVDATHLTAILPAGDTATAGAHGITVLTPAPGGGVSNTLVLTVAPPPTVTPNAQTVVTGGTMTFVVTDATSLLDRAVLYCPETSLDANSIDWKYLSDTQTPPTTPANPATVTFAAPAAVGATCNVRLFAGSTGSKVATSATVTVVNAVPTLTLLSPGTVLAGSGALTLTVTGTRFVQGSTVRVDGATRLTTFVDPTQLTANLTAGDTAAAGSHSITVLNPAPGGGTSNAVLLQVAAPPTVTPRAQTVAAGATMTFTVANGPGNVLDWVGLYCPASTADGSYIDRKYLNDSSTPPPIGRTSAAITFTSPSTVGATCNMRLFANDGFTRLATSATVTVVGAGPTLVMLSPSTVSAGADRFTLTVTGTNFLPGAVVQVDGSSRQTTFVDAAHLTASISSRFMDSAGTLTITVVNPAPNGGTSNALPLTVAPRSRR